MQYPTVFTPYIVLGNLCIIHSLIHFFFINQVILTIKSLYLYASCRHNMELSNAVHDFGKFMKEFYDLLKIKVDRLLVY